MERITMSIAVTNDVRAIENIIQKLGDLPSAPPILQKVIQLTSNIDSHVADVAHSIAADQSISAKVVRMSNSPIFARAKRVSTLDEAIKVLGFNQLKSIIITASTFQMFETSTHADIATKLWHHSFSTAIGSRIIAERLTTLNKDEAYLAGLLHDIGKLIFLKTTPHVYAQLVDNVKQNNTVLLAEEQREFGFDHTDLGAALLEKWAIPGNILSAVADHHKCSLTEAPPTEQLERVVALANAVSQYIGTDFYEPYNVGIEEQYYLGPDPIEGERLIMIRCDTESVFNNELSLLYE
jgi:putative nucleotidyltransferase with HDIG domain